VRLWDVKTGEVVGRWIGHTDIVRQVCWSPDGERVVIQYSDGTVRVWDIENRKSVLLRNKMTTYAMAYSPDGKKIATGGQMDEYGVKIWNAKTAELLFTVDHDLSDSSMAWSSDSQSSLHWVL
jgi:WD40 repeat protein